MKSISMRIEMCRQCCIHVCESAASAICTRRSPLKHMTCMAEGVPMLPREQSARLSRFRLASCTAHCRRVHVVRGTEPRNFGRLPGRRLARTSSG